MAYNENGLVLLSSDVDLSVSGTTLVSKGLSAVSNAIAAYFGDLKAGADAASNLVEAAAAIEITTPIGTQLWHLIVRSTAWSLANLMTSCNKDGDRKELAKSLFTEAKAGLGTAEASVGPSFLTRPANNAFYMKMRDFIAHQRHVFRAVKETDQAFIAQFDSLFNRGVFEMFSRNSALYSEAVKVLGRHLAETASEELEWKRYRTYLQYEYFGRPVFGQDDSGISLSQLCVPLRCLWHCPIEKSMAIGKEEEEAIAPAELAYLRDTVMNWIKSDAENPIFLIGGGPGSGKSTSVKSIASDISAADEFRPLFVPLQRIDTRADLRDSINRLFTEKSKETFSYFPLAREHISKCATYVIIFDGLDELAQPGEAADQVTGQFILKLVNLVTALRNEGACVRAIVTGRIPSFQSAHRHLALPVGQSVEVVGYAPLEDYRYRVPERLIDPDNLATVDQRSVWWGKYAALKALPPELPPAMAEPSLSSITNEPLLCYLLVLADFVGPNWELAAENKNRIYEKLIIDIWRRGWGDGVGSARRQGPGRTLSQQDFVKLMETIALAAWLGGDSRVSTEANFLSAIGFMNAQAVWDAFRADNGEDVTNLAMNFYLKSAEAAHRGFEFTHKSFGEYLAARALLTLGYEIGSASPTIRPLMSSSWVDRTGSGEMTDEILDFLKAEADLEIRDRGRKSTVIAIKSGLTDLLGIAVNRGLAPSPHKYDYWLKGEQLEKDAQIALWSIVHRLAHAIYCHDPNSPDVKINIETSAGQSLTKAISRLTDNRAGVVLRCLLGVNFSREFFVGWNGFADFRACDLSKSLFHCCGFWSSRFDGANLEGSTLSCSTFYSNSFDGAIIKNVTVNWCSFEQSDFWPHVEGRLRTDKASLLVGGTKPGPYTVSLNSPFSHHTPSPDLLLERYQVMSNRLDTEVGVTPHE